MTAQEGAHKLRQLGGDADARTDISDLATFDLR